MTRIFIGTFVLSLLFGAVEAKAEFPRDLQGRWSTTAATCGNATMQIKGDQFRFNGRQCTRHRAICTFWKEDIAPGNDCTVIVNCQGEFTHAILNFVFESRDKARLVSGKFDHADPKVERLETFKEEIVLNRCKR